MAYTNNGQTRVGVRIVPLSVVIPTISALLDSYSGAAAAYSLRKLNSSYTGSAIRVRRSSDNTEMNIGFDSNGNLDTYSLSSFVGSGNGFVTTWYDQSGNLYNLTQNTSSDNQPTIVTSGTLIISNNKPSVLFDGINDCLVNFNSGLGTSFSGDDRPLSMFSILDFNTTQISTPVSFARKLTGTALEQIIPYAIDTSNFYAYKRDNSGVIKSYTFTPITTGQKLFSSTSPGQTLTVKQNGVTKLTNSDVNVSTITIDNLTLGALTRNTTNNYYFGKIQEVIVYPSDKSSIVISIESNINTYYSAYPNPTSVWNLLNAVYSADTTASPSLKTSLYAAYNGESNANDSFGSNNGTAVGGLTYGTGKIGNAFNFNGKNAYVSLPNNSWNFTGNFSISMWVKFSSSSLSQILISNFTIGGATTVSGWFIEKTDNAELRFRGYNNGSLVLNATKIAFSPSTSVYTHLVVSRSATNSKIYINGVLDITSTVTAAPNYESTNYPMIGANRYNSTTYQEFFNGNIDGVNIWQKELTQSEITELYNSGNGAQYIGDNFYKPTTNDALGTNNGTAQGGLTYGVGKVGTACQFNGTNAYVSLPTSSLQLTKFSINFWIFNPATQTTTIAANFGNDGQNKGWYLDLINTNGHGIRFVAFNNNVNIIGLNAAATSAGGYTNRWSMATLTVNGTSVKMYLDGSLVSSGTMSNTINYTTTTYPLIGGYRVNNGGVSALLSNNTRLDAFNIWDKELSASEITELYNSGNGKQYPN